MKNSVLKRVTAAFTAGVLASTMIALPSQAFAAEGDGLPSADSLAGDTAVIYTGNLRGDITQYAKIKAIADAYEAATGKDPVLVDAGNFYQGSRYAAADQGETVAKAMREVGYDAAVPGVNDFSFGTAIVGYPGHASTGDFRGNKSLTANLADTTTLSGAEAAAIKLVASNVSGSTNDWRANQLGLANPVLAIGEDNASAIVASGDVNVGIVGTTDPAAQTTALASAVGSWEFAGEANAAAAAKSLKDADQADVVISVSNLPTNPVKPSDTDAAVNVAPAAFGQAQTAGVIVFDADNKIVEDQSKTLNLGSIEADPAVTATIKAATDEIDQDNAGAIALNVAQLSGQDAVVRGGESALGDLYADSFAWYAMQSPDLSADIAAKGVAADNVIGVINGGNLTDSLYEGEVLVDYSLRQTDFHPNALTVYYLTGAQLLEQFEANSQSLPFTSETRSGCASLLQVSSNVVCNIDTSIAFDAGAPINDNWSEAASVQRTTLFINGTKVAADDTLYAVVGHDKMSKGIDAVNYLFFEAPKNETTIPVNTALMRYLTAAQAEGGLGGTITADAYSDSATGSRITFGAAPIERTDQVISVKTASKQYTVKQLKSKAYTFKIGATTTGDGTITYKVAKAAKKYLTVNKNGKVKVAKKTPKGTYKVKVIAPETEAFNAATQVVKVKVKK